jgi:hypothetical protein
MGLRKDFNILFDALFSPEDIVEITLKLPCRFIELGLFLVVKGLSKNLSFLIILI